MSSLLSVVLAWIYLEFLEPVPFKYIIPSNSNYFLYIDDILLIYPQELDLTKITDRLIKIEPMIKFTHELETYNSLPFFFFFQYFFFFIDILLLRNNDKLEFKVFCKPTCKNDCRHFHSYHNTNTKRGIIIGFYLRALCICSPKYQDEEFNYLENSILNILYSKPFIQFAKSKALKTHKSKWLQTSINTPNIIRLPYKHIILPSNSSINFIENNWNKHGIKTHFFS